MTISLKEPTIMRIVSAKNIVLAPLAALLIASCVAYDEGGMDAVDTALEAEAIMELDREWAQRFADRDFDWIAALLAQDAVLLAPGVDIMHGPEVIRGAWEGMATTIPGTSWEPVMAKVSSSGDMAYVYGTASVVDADGNATPMKYLEVWVKIDGEWKVAADVFNANGE